MTVQIKAEKNKQPIVNTRSKSNQTSSISILPVDHIRTDTVYRKALCSCGGTCPKCKGKLAAQAKFKLGAVDDKYEREADRVADQVMRMPDTPRQNYSIGESSAISPNIRRETVEHDPEQQTEKELDEEELIQTKFERNDAVAVSDSVADKIKVLKEGGNPLSQSTHDFFSTRMGYDFSDVRVHTGSKATDAAQSINARAFTLNRDIVFNKGEYSPDTSSGQRLLAHELTHIRQQGGGIPMENTLSPDQLGKPTITKKSDKQIRRQINDRVFERHFGLDQGIRAGTLRPVRNVHGQVFSTPECFGRPGCRIEFKFMKAYIGESPRSYIPNSRVVRFAYVKIRMKFVGACANCRSLEAIQIVRDTNINARGNIISAEPNDQYRQQRSGWDNPRAPSRGWRVDMLENITDPFYSHISSGESGGPRGYATIIDAPFTWMHIRNRGREFQTCLICVSGNGERSTLGCVRWGFYAHSRGITFLPAIPVPTCGQSVELRDAANRWDTIQGNQPVNLRQHRPPRTRNR